MSTDDLSAVVLFEARDDADLRGIASALRRELAEKMAEALQQLPEKHREILVLREVEGMSYEDLARVLDIPKGTVMSRLFHARSKMQKLLEGYLEGDRPEYGVGEDEG